MSGAQSGDEIITRLQEIDRYGFEDFIGEVFELDGWETTVTEDSDDDGIDVIAEKNGFLEQKVAVQAKRPDPGNKVGKGDVQQYSALVRDNTDTDIAVVVTSAAFTKGGYQYGTENNVKLLDGAMLSGLIEARGAGHLLDNYAPNYEEIEIDGEFFSPAGDHREQYLRKRPISAAESIFSEKSFLQAMELIQESETGVTQINALEDLRKAIRNSPASLPTDVFRSSPEIIDQNWYDVQYLDDLAERVTQEAREQGFTSAEFEVLCYTVEGSVYIPVILPESEEIHYHELELLEFCADFVAEDTDINDSNPKGCILAGELSNIERKIRRCQNDGLEASTYQMLLERAVQTNRELFQMIKPYLRASGDEETLEKIVNLQTVVRGTEVAQ